MVWHKIKTHHPKKPTTAATERFVYSKALPSKLFDVLKTADTLPLPAEKKCKILSQPSHKIAEESALARELKFFILTVFVSFLLWVSLALIIEQNIIAPEHTYLRERNAFFLTIVFFYFLRLSAWITNKDDRHEDTSWKIKIPVTRRDILGRRFVGYAKDEAGQMKNDGRESALISTP